MADAVNITTAPIIAFPTKRASWCRSQKRPARAANTTAHLIWEADRIFYKPETMEEEANIRRATGTQRAALINIKVY